jgi:hypothetical protein
MDPMHRTVGEMEPGDDMDRLANGQVPHCLLALIVEDQPGVGTALDTLLWCVGGIGERGLDMTDRAQLEVHG